MASSYGGVIQSNLFSLLHRRDGHSSSSRQSLSSNSLSNKKQKFNAGVTASHDKNASAENSNTMETNDRQRTSEKRHFTRSLDFSGDKPYTPILDTINYPIHMKNLSIQELESLADELREEIVYTVAKTGGHLSSSLGVAELTVALHHVFNTPEDKIIWDVGHQSYPHKILTGRRSKMHTIRQTFGLAGFPKRDESVHDAFGAGHSSTSISAGLGMAVGRDLLGKSNHVVSVIGDGAMTGGQAYEAMNNAGFLDTNLTIILNDNEQVSLPTATVDGPAPPVGALSRALTKLQASRKFRQFREATKGITKQMGSQAHEIAAKVDTYVRGMVGGAGACFFEDLGLYYIGPVDGHNVEDLVHILSNVKAMPAPGPVLIHVITKKGKGYAPAEVAADKMHGVVKFEPKTGKQLKTKLSTLSYTQYFAESLIAEAEKDDKIIAIHAAMGGGTGLNLFQKRFPERCFDVGIAEQHAVTFAAGLATEGLKPFCAIYSTFLQRGYDQVAHDVDLQKLPVRFALDRAGLVGADGPTHCGAFDTTFMACLPNMVVMAPSCEAELIHMVATAAAIDDRPSCFRFPRGNGIGSVIPPYNKGTPLEVGKGRVLKEGSRVAILGYGTIVQSCLAAAKLLEELGISITIADARFCKPLDGSLIRQLAQEHEILITAEEGSIGGFSSHVSHFLGLNGLLDGNLKWRAMMLPDRYINHGSQTDQIEEAKGFGSNLWREPSAEEEEEEEKKNQRRRKMKTILSSETMDIPDGVSIKVKAKMIEVEGPRGKLTRNFKHLNLDFQLIKDEETGQTKLKIEAWFGSRKTTAAIRTALSHVENLITGVTKGYRYKMRFVYAHFPINASITNSNKSIEIRNFLGEKKVRKVDMLDGVTIVRSEKVKDELMLDGNDIELVSRSCALINQKCHVKKKDIRKFLDGIYVSEKATINVEE